MDKPTEVTSTWFILNTAHGKYICCAEVTASKVLQGQSDEATIECKEAYELFTPLQQVPSQEEGKIGIAKEAIATPLDTNASPTSTFFCLSNSRITLFSNMSEGDQDTYKRLVEMARGMGEAWRVQRSGIVVPSISLK